MAYSQEYRDGFDHGRNVGLATAQIRNAEVLEAMQQALQCINRDVESMHTGLEEAAARDHLLAAIARATGAPQESH